MLVSPTSPHIRSQLAGPIRREGAGRNPRLVLLQHPDDLVFAKPAALISGPFLGPKPTSSGIKSRGNVRVTDTARAVRAVRSEHSTPAIKGQIRTEVADADLVRF